MKLENNSLKYGINAYNGVQGAYNNAYQQEMENQRNMQTQVTQRQRTLLDSLNSEFAVGTNAQGGGSGHTRGGGTYGGGSNIPYTAATLDAMEQNVLDDKARYDKFYRETQESMPTRGYLKPDGTLGFAQSDRGFSYTTANTYGDPKVLAFAKQYNISPRQAFMQLHPNHSAPLPAWDLEVKK